MAIAKDLVSGILSGNINTSATNIIVSIGEGLSSSQITGFFPPTPFHMTIMPKSPTIGVANSFDSEVVKVTAVAADQSGDASLTVARGQYDTTAKSFDSGAIVTLGVYAEDAVFKSDDVLPPAEAWVGSDDIKANAVKASNIDFATFDFGEKREVGKLGNYTVYAQTFQDTIGAQNTWKSFGNIGTGKIGLFAFGSFVAGTENHFFPGGTSNTEMTTIYYEGSTGTVNVKTIYAFPVNASARVTIFWLE